MKKRWTGYALVVVGMMLGVGLATPAQAQNPKKKGAMQQKKGGDKQKKDGKEHGKAGESGEHGDHGHKQGDHGHKHGDHGHKHGDHGHKQGDHGHKHGDHGHDHGDHGLKEGTVQVGQATSRAMYGKKKCDLKKEWQKHTRRMAKIARVASLSKEAGKSDLEAVAARIREKEGRRHQKVLRRCLPRGMGHGRVVTSAEAKGNPEHKKNEGSGNKEKGNSPKKEGK